MIDPTSLLTYPLWFSPSSWNVLQQKLESDQSWKSDCLDLTRIKVDVNPREPRESCMTLPFHPGTKSFCEFHQSQQQCGKRQHFLCWSHLHEKKHTHTSKGPFNLYRYLYPPCSWSSPATSVIHPVRKQKAPDVVSLLRQQLEVYLYCDWLDV